MQNAESKSEILVELLFNSAFRIPNNPGVAQLVVASR